ncbi:MAG: M14 family metallopeptidase [Elusimicrobiales bacterium]|nr:M14 family metallopeptidase [Elusimicrobiales bacterium]
MHKLILSFILTVSAAAPVFSAENTSYDQLLGQLTSVQAEIPLAPVADKAAFASATEGRYWVTVKAADKRARTKLLEAGFDIVEINGDKVSGIAGPELMELLSSKSFGLVEKTALAALVPDTKDFPSQDAIYHNYQETYDLLKQLASANSDIASLFSIGKTVEGRDIWCLRLNSSVKGDGPSSKPGAFFMGNLHAREHLTTEVSVLLAAWLLEHRNDADVKKYLSTLDIYIAPMANPDGSEYDIRTGSYQYYRKNMAKNADKSRGVDLNRNFDSWWCESGASTYPGSDTYCGPKAFSEPESVNIKRFFEGRRNLKTHITYHSYASEILYPWGGNEADVPNDKDKRAFIKIAAEMGKLTNYSPIKSSDMYVATGDSADWVYAATGALAFTFELEGRGFYPGAAIVKGAVERNIKAAVYLLSVTDDPYKVI